MGPPATTVLLFQAIDTNAPAYGISYQQGLEKSDRQSAMDQLNAEEKGTREASHNKDKRKSLSRRVSFSSKTRVKEFHEGQHEVR